jgi:hypothetical protein
MKNRMGKNSSSLDSYFKIMDDAIAPHAAWWPRASELRKLTAYGGVHDPSDASGSARILFVDWQNGSVYAYLEQWYLPWIKTGVEVDKRLGADSTRMVTMTAEFQVR